MYSYFIHHSERILEKISEFIEEQWKSVLFSAALAGILEHFGLLKIFTKYSWLIVASLASLQSNNNVILSDAAAIIVTVNDDWFLSHYGEKRPLDRCALRDDIQSILNKQPYRLAIDFDMSPLLKPSEPERICQQNLDNLLDKYHDSVAILTPFAAKGELKAIKHAWMQQRCAAGGHFADGTLSRSLGMLNEQIIGDDPLLQTRFAEQLKFGLNGLICRDIASLKSPDDNRWLDDQSEMEIEGHSAVETKPINFLAAQKKLSVLEMGTSNFAQLSDLTGHIVLFGGSWGTDDQFLTPLGEIPGIAVHGARLASLDLPAITPGPIVGLLIDVCIALCFALIVKRFWNSYIKATRFDQEIGHVTRGHLRSALGTFVIILFVLTYMLLVLYFLLASEHLYQRYSIMLTPLVMAIAILFDGFVSAPIEQIHHLLEAQEQREHQNEQVLHEHDTDLSKELKAEGKHLNKGGVTSAIVFLCLLMTVLLGIFCKGRNWHLLADFIFIGPVLLMMFSAGLSLVYRLLTSILSRKKKQNVVHSLSLKARFIRFIKNLLPYKSIPNSVQEQKYKKYNISVVKIGYSLYWLRAVLFWGVLLYYGYLHIHSMHG